MLLLGRLRACWHRPGKADGSCPRLARLPRLALLVCCLVFAGQALAEAIATVNRTQLQQQETVNLTIRTTKAATNANPNFAPLNQDFEVLSHQQSQQSSISFINGQAVSENYRDHQLLLRPRRVGRLVIPALQVGQHRTQPIEINVLPTSAAQQQAAAEYVFFETAVDANEVYVQSQIIYTVKLFYMEGIGGEFTGQPKVNETVVEIIETENRYETILHGRRYFVWERRYALFPQARGEIQIPGERFSGTRGQGGPVSRRQRVDAVSNGHRVRVKPKPDSFTGDNWIPAKSLTLTESWDTQPPVFTLGEPVNRKLVISAAGLVESLLPPLDNLEMEGAKVYVDPPAASKQITQRGVNAQQVITLSLVPTKEGELTLPAIRIPWWNTELDREEVAEIPAATYEVLPGAGVNLTTPTVSVPLGTAPVPQANPLWQYLSAGLAVLLLISTWQWLTLKRQVLILSSARQQEYVTTQDNPDESRLYGELLAACKRNQPAEAHSRLLLWARARNPATSCLADLTLGNAEMAAEVQALETSLYGAKAAEGKTPSNWRGTRLATLIAALKQPQEAPDKKQDLAASLNPA